MFRKEILIFVKIVAFSALCYQAEAEDLCNDFEVQDITDCCRDFISATNDGLKYTSCLSDDDPCQEATCALELDYVLVDGKINKTAAIYSAMGELSKKTWLSVFTSAYSTCSNLSKLSDCPAMIMYYCMRPTAFLHCPRSEWTESEICRDAKRYVKQCQLPQLKPE